MTRGVVPFVILGGGPCGLAAAWRLVQLGHRPIVLERETLVGGLCATHQREGYRFDLGGHRFVSSDTTLSRRLESLLGDQLLTQDRRSVVLHGGRTFRYPLEAVDLVQSLGWRENALALAGFARARLDQLVSPKADVSFQDWVTFRFGKPLYDTFFGPYTEKLWGLHPSRISADWAAERISLLHLGDAALRLTGLRRTPIRTYARSFRYPRLGMGQMYEVMAREIRDAGGEIRTGVRVAGLDVDRGRVTAVRIETATGAERVPVGEMLSTIPLPDLARFLRPDLPSSLAGAARNLRFRALVFLNVMLGRENFSENTWLYVASKEHTMSRIQEPKRRSKSMAPEGRTSIMLEIPCDVGDGTWLASTEDLLERARRELGALSFPLEDVLGAFAVRVAHGYPVYHLGYDSDRRALIDFVRRFENVRTAGRQGLFRYVFMDAAMQMGSLAADQMIAGTQEPSRLDAIGRSRTLVETAAITA